MTTVRKQKAKPVDKATPVIRKPKGKDGDKITVTRSTTTAMKQAPLWNTTPALQAAVTTWNAAADSIESNAKAIADLRAQLATLDAAQRTHRQDWRVATKQVIAVAGIACQGSPDQVHQLGLDVLTHVGPIQQVAPSGITSQPGTVSGEVVVRWTRGSARHGFLVQRAVDVASPAMPVASTKTRFLIDGAVPASIIHVRVAAIDATSSTGQSPWSDWVACTVR